jgi:hypothetical protein
MLSPLSYIAPPAPPKPADPAEMERWDMVARAFRLLYGLWQGDLEARVNKVVGNVRRGAWKQVDLSANLFRQVWDALATLYDQMPLVEHDSPSGRELAALIEESGYWTKMQRIQRDTLGMREMLVRVDVADGKLTYRSVTPGQVCARASYDRPDVPVEIFEARLRQKGDTNEQRWTWDHLSVFPGRPPVYEVIAENGDDVSAEYIGRRYAGDAYPYRKSDGTPVLPYVLYHAQDAGCLWDSASTLELIEATYNGGVYYSMFGHVLRSAAWRQKYGIDVEVQGAGIAETDDDTGAGARKEVVADPATILMLRTIQHDGQSQPSVGAWEEPVDPVAYITAVRTYEARGVSFAGVNAADQMRMSGDPRSGYAVSVSRDSQRQVQRRYEPVFRRADLQLIELSAAMLNRATNSAHPEEGYRIRYEGIPLSPEERDALRRHVLEQLDKGLLTPVLAYMELHPGVSEAEAQKIIDEIDARRAERAPDITGGPPTDGELDEDDEKPEEEAA